jgi:hypothetical protein
MGNNNNHDHINEVMDRDVADSVPVATINDLKSKTNVNDQTAYIIAETFTGNPYQLLGQVVEIRKTNGECPSSLVNGRDLNFEFSPIPLTGFKVDEQTKMKQPVLRGSIIVDKALSAQAGFLSFLSAQLDQKSSFSLMVMDQVSGIVDFQDNSWKDAVKQWKEENQDKMNDPEICFIYVVTGFVQKNIIKKKYYQFEAGAKGGAYGININGKLSTSSDEYSLDIIFGLSPAIIKRPVALAAEVRAITDLEHEPTTEEFKLFAKTTGAEIKKD